jgi:nucleoside-diphosphate-sugar epimerase
MDRGASPDGREGLAQINNGADRPYFRAVEEAYSQPRRMAELIVELTESRSEIVFEALPVDDPQVRQPDITRANQALAGEPEVDVREGLRRTIAHYTAVLLEPAPH